MSHGITAEDKMAYVGKTPWHRLGEYMGEKLLDGNTMYNQTMDWQVEKRPILFKGRLGSSDELTEFEEYFVTLRSDTFSPLGVVGKDWEGIQNKSCFEFIDTVLDKAELPRESFETAGTLFGGKRVFVLANLGRWAVQRGSMFSRKQDEHVSYLLSTMAHDGTLSWMGLFTDIRVVCNNTNQFALDKATNLFKVKHTLKAEERIQLAGRLAAGHLVYQKELREQFEQLDKERFQARQTRAWAAAVLADMENLVGCQGYEQVIDAMPVIERHRNVPSPQDIVAEQSGQVQDLFLHGKGNNGSTKYDGLNGLTQWLDHQRDRYKRSKDVNSWQQKRFVDTFSGENARIRNRGLRLLTRW